MTLDEFKNALPDYAKDTRLNLSSLLNGQAMDDLSAKQIASVALACAFATKQDALIEAIGQYSQSWLEDSDTNGVKTAVSLMAMNNVYYRFTHMVSDSSFQTLPAKLRMNQMMNPGIAKADFELVSLAVSAINGCQLCIDTHVSALKQHGFSQVAIQTAIRLAAVLQAAAQSWLMSRY